MQKVYSSGHLIALALFSLTVHLGSVYTGPTEYLVGRTRGRLIDLKVGHLGVQIFGRLGKRPSLELERPSSRTALCKRI